MTEATATTAGQDGLLTLDELTARVGLSVRTVRFYTSRGLVRPPIRRGRSGFYDADHVARLELVRDLQSHGLTLAAIKSYLDGIPATASAADLALRRALLAPWREDAPELMDRDELHRRAGRELADAELATLAALGVVTPTGEEYAVAAGRLTAALALVDSGLSTQTARAVAAVYERHGREVARELGELFHRQVWPAMRDSGAPPEQLREAVELLKPLSIASLVAAYESAMDDAIRQVLARRTH